MSRAEQSKHASVPPFLPIASSSVEGCGGLQERTDVRCNVVQIKKDTDTDTDTFQ